jgi:hypothetical protein
VIANLKASFSFARNNDVAMPRAQFDLANVSAGPINLLGDQGRALLASGLFTS